jgi:competence ComEA-like helix-hairpin-helix protein
MPAERRAVLLLLGLAVAGQGLRLWRNAPDEAPGAVSVFAELPTAEPRAHRDSSVALARPLAPGERIDVDRASAPELARLPRVGLSLAKAIVADRDAHGPFGSLERLDRVPGVGPGLLARIAPHVTFSAPSLPPSPGQSLRASPEGGAPAAQAAEQLVDLNAATAAELERLPFIGPALAERIVTFRARHGPFPSVDSLIRVPGIGPATLTRIRSRLRT